MLTGIARVWPRVNGDQLQRDDAGEMPRAYSIVTSHVFHSSGDTDVDHTTLN